MLRPSSSHTARMAAIIRALFLLILFSQLLQAAPFEPATPSINPAVNSDDPSQQFRVQVPKNEPELSSENNNKNNASPDPSNEGKYTLFLPGTSLWSCFYGFFQFSVKAPDSPLNSTPLLFPYSNNSNGSWDALHGGGMVFSCDAKPNDEKEGEMKVTCRCDKEHHLSSSDIIFLWVGGFAIVASIFSYILKPPCTEETVRGGDMRRDHNIMREPRVYQRVSQTGSGTETEGKDTVETVFDDEIGEDFDDSNYPMG